MEGPAETRRALDDMHDSPEELEPAHPLGDALLLCRELLVPCHDGAAARAAEIGSRRATLAFWSAASGAAAVILSIAALALSAAGKMPAGAARPLDIVQAAAAAACFLLLGARAVAGSKSKWVADLARVERCRAAKFRFLLDPSLWSRRGQEAQERTAGLRAEAEGIAAAGNGAAEWASADTIPVVRTIPVGSGIDPHTVHTLMDYYQARRIDPQLARLSREAASAGALGSIVSPGGLLAGSVAVVLAEGALAAATKGGAALIGPGLSAALVALAASLPFAGAALSAWTSRSAADRERRRARARHRALSDLSERLQKVSGAEAIFRELGFCEDVLEAEGRERLRAAVEGGRLA
jgi:hypothetical protein